MDTPKKEYYTNMLEKLDNYNDRNNGPFSNGKIKQAISRVMVETEEEERDAERNANHVTMDTISNIYMGRSTLDLTTIGLNIHSTISSSQHSISS